MSSLEENDLAISSFQQTMETYDKDYILEIEIIDTGEGIDPDRQSMLFIPFLELKELQGIMNKPKNDNIGLGLSASRKIIRELQGDLIIKQSKQGLTVFKMRFPIKVPSQQMPHNKSNRAISCQDLKLSSINHRHSNRRQPDKGYNTLSEQSQCQSKLVYLST